jgi:hypothetical protein
MIYTKIFSPKYRNYIRGITYSVFFAFLLSLTSCYTVSEETISPKELYIKDNYTILEAKLKNDSVVNLEEYNVRHIPKSDNTKGVLRCVEKESVYSQVTGRKDSAQKKNMFDLKVENISKLKIETSKSDAATTLIISGSVILLLSLIVFIAIQSTGPNFNGN